MFCVFTTGREEKIASLLNIPLLAVRKSCLSLGTKSGSRESFLRTRVAHPQGTKLCFSKCDLAKEVAATWGCLLSKYKVIAEHNQMDRDYWRTLMPRKLVIKLNDAFSGEGNALLDIQELHSYQGDDSGLPIFVEKLFNDDHMRFQAPSERWENFLSNIEAVGALAEVFLWSDTNRNPSGQACIDSDGQVHLMATHEQMMGGPDGQNYQGCVFPAWKAYRSLIHSCVLKVGQYLASCGAIGHFSVDFFARLVDLDDVDTRLRLQGECHTCEDHEAPDSNYAIEEDGRYWDLHALEINLRPGGATHPIMTLNLLTNGMYDEKTGLYTLDENCPIYADHQAKERYYVASDNVRSSALIGMPPNKIISLLRSDLLEFDGRRATGTIFHMLSCAQEFGKLGMVCIGRSPSEASAIYEATVQCIEAHQQSSCCRAKQLIVPN